MRLYKLMKNIALIGILAVLIMGFAVPVAAAPVSKEQAEEIALRIYPGATVVKVEHERKILSRVSYYEVKLLIDDVKVEVKIDADTGKPRPGHEKNLLNEAAITPAQARDIALKLHEGATVTKTKLEQEKDVLIYEIKLKQADGSKAKVHVNAATGDIIAD